MGGEGATPTATALQRGELGGGARSTGMGGGGAKSTARALQRGELGGGAKFTVSSSPRGRLLGGLWLGGVERANLCGLAGAGAFAGSGHADVLAALGAGV